MSFFLYKLLPPRPTFLQDMTSLEAEIMRDHGAYWSDLSRKGVAAVFGPVADPQGAWGMAVVEVPSDADAHTLGTNDPAVTAGRGFTYEVHPMPQAIFRASADGNS